MLPIVEKTVETWTLLADDSQMTSTRNENRRDNWQDKKYGQASNKTTGKTCWTHTMSVNWDSLSHSQGGSGQNLNWADHTRPQKNRDRHFHSQRQHGWYHTRMRYDVFWIPYGTSAMRQNRQKRQKTKGQLYNKKERRRGEQLRALYQAE